MHCYIFCTFADVMKKILFFVCACIIAFLTSCSSKTETETKTTEPEQLNVQEQLVMQIRQCSRIYPTEYRIHKVVTHDDQLRLSGKFLGHGYNVHLPLGKRKIAIPIDATVKSYIDMSGFSTANVVRTDSTHIEIILPDPHFTLTASKINHNDIREFVALTRSNFSDEELASYEAQGRDAIIADINKLNLVESARSGAANVIVPIVVAMGYKAENITVTFRKDFVPDNILSSKQQTTSIEHAAKR